MHRLQSRTPRSPEIAALAWMWAMLAMPGTLVHAQPTGAPPDHETSKVDGQLRNYLMGTFNRGEALDWHQWTLGGQLGYVSPRWHGLSLGARVYTAAGVWGNSHALDENGNVYSRYEAGLLDFTDRRNKDLAVLGEAFIDYQRPGHSLWVGRHRLKTPMLNPQDGRMIPTLFQGGWYRYSGLDGLNVDVGFLSHAYARSGPRFRSIEDTFGIYPQGRNTDGTPASYAGNVESLGIFVGGLGFANAVFAAQAWDYLFDNVFNVVYADAFVTPKLGDGQLRVGGQYIGGQRVNDGGATADNERYFQDDAYHVFGAKAEFTTASALTLGANYNRVTADGRFVFPRELGVEPLFVFQKRERTEGSGDVHGFMFELKQAWQVGGAIEQVTSAVSYGQSYRTDPRQAALNKNGFPSLYQLNWDSFVHLDGVLDGLVAELLVVYKGPLADTHDNPRFVVNKVDMLHVDLIANYNF